MPTFSNISNGESGLSVRNTLNQVIDYVNTGTTYASGYTYITEGTTPGSEFVNILSPRDVYISGGTSVEIEYYGSPTITSYLYMDNTNTLLHTDDGSSYSTQTIVPTSNSIVSYDGANTGSTSTSKSSVVLSQTDGSNTGEINVTASSSSVENMDGTGNYANIVFSPTDATIQSSDGVTNTGTIFVESNGNITSTSTDGDNLTQLQMFGSGGLDIQFNNSNITDTYYGYVSMTSGATDISLTDISSQITDTLYLNPSNSGGGGGLGSTEGVNSSFYKIRPNELTLQSTDGSSTNTLIFSPDYMNWDNDYVTGDTRVGLEFDPSGGVGQTRFYKENYVTNEQSGIYLQTNSVLLNWVDSGSSANYLEINNLGIDSQVVSGVTQFQTTDNINSNTLTLAPTNTTLLSTDGTDQSQIYQDNVSVSITSSDVSDTSAVSLTPTTAGLSVDTPSNSRYNEVTLTTGINLLSSSGGTSSNIQVNDNILLFNSTDGVDAGEFRVEPKGITFKFIPAFDDDADAGTGGLTVDMLYQTTGLGAAPLDVAGILMIKQ